MKQLPQVGKQSLGDQLTTLDSGGPNKMKSVEIKFNEALAAIDKAGRRKAFDEKVKGCTTIESKLNAAEAVLQDVGVVRAKESVKKNNGAGDNFVENNPFRPVEEFRENFSPG